MSPVDAVVIGSGPNGLVAANLLADHGWSVLVLEAQDRIGGAVASTEEVRPGWVHDTFSSFYPLAAASPTIQSLALERFGLEWSTAPAVVGHPMPDGRWTLLHPRREDTAAGLDALHPGDGEAWLRLCGIWDRVGGEIIEALLTPFPPVRAAAQIGLRVPRLGGLAFVRDLILPVRRLGTEWFGGEGPRVLLAANAAHSDIGMDTPGSGLMGLLLVMLGQQYGFPVPKGGAGQLAAALASRLDSAGGTVRTGVRVEEVLVKDSQASGVRLDNGEVVEAARAVLADVSVTALYGDLVPWSALPSRTRRAMESFDWDPGTVKVDWALSAPIPWDQPPEAAPGTVHLADSVSDLASSEVQLEAGKVPDKGLVIVGQMATSDPTRAPAGAESAWAYTHVPHRGPDDPSGPLGEEVVAEVVASVEARVEARAPGFRDLVLDRRVLAPTDLESRDENLVGGSLNGGTAAPHQQLVLRPVPGIGRAETPIRGLYLASASAHPGGGVHGACGSNAARAAIAHDRLRRLTTRPLWPRRVGSDSGAMGT